MFIGHFAVAFATKRYAPRASLGALLGASLLPDLLWPLFLLLGWEVVRIDPNGMKMAPFDFVSYPWSHSLLMCAAWAATFALIFYGITRYAKGTIAIAIAVLSHWVLDWITHKPDLPLYPGGQRLGLGLWNFVDAAVTLELSMFAVGVLLYLFRTRARDRIGRYACWGFVALLTVAYLSNIASNRLPNSVNEGIAWPGLILGVVMLLWAWWFDRHRIPTEK
jgi:hypothetical protein